MITLSTKSLAAALAKCKAIALTTTPLDIVKCVMLIGRPENAWLTITCTNLEAQIAVDVEADVGEAFSCCVDLSRFVTATNVPGEETKIVMEGERVKVSTGKSVFRLPYRAAEDFPLITSQGETLAAFKCEWLGPILSRFTPFASDGEITRPFLNSVSLRNVGGMLQIDASNGHIAAHMEREIEEKRDFSVLVPIRVARALAAYEPTRAIVKAGGVTFLGESTQVHSQVLEGMMPDMRPHFASADKGEPVNVKRSEMIRAVKSCAAMAEGSKIRAVRFGAAGNAPFVEVANISTSVGTAKFDLMGSAEDFEIGFMDRVMLTLLESTGDEDVKLLRHGAERVYLKDGDFCAVGMSLRL